MKKALLILTLAAFAFSPLMVSQAQAATGKHGLKHHKNAVKKHSVQRLSHRHSHRHQKAA